MEKKSLPVRGGGISRRCLLGCAGKLAVGTAAFAVSGGHGVLPEAAAKEAAPLPWPYKKLDVEEVGDITYNQWYTGLCANAVLTGLVAPLRRTVGEPYTSFPIEAFVWGHGGVVGWGTMCGTMLGAATAANLICGPGLGKGGEQVTNEVVHFYANTDLPTYKPKQPKVAADPVISRSNSPLCHLSVGKWMQKADCGFWTPERKDRCARLAANVAMQTATYMNAFADGTFKAEHKFPANAYNITAQHNCVECHGDGIPSVNKKGNPIPQKKT